MAINVIDRQFFDVACQFHADGGLYLPDFQSLIISDLHIGKGAAHRRNGQIPGYDTDNTLARLDAAISHAKPKQTILLGDSFHSQEQANSLPTYHREHIAQIATQTQLIWIEGNHDPHLPHSVPGEHCSYLSLGTLLLSHQPVYQSDHPKTLIAGQIVGHFHPKAKLQLSARNFSAKCFIHDASLMILPAFGAYTGGLNILHTDIQALFGSGQQSYLLHQQAIYHFPVSRRHFKYA